MDTGTAFGKGMPFILALALLSGPAFATQPTVLAI